MLRKSNIHKQVHITILLILLLLLLHTAQARPLTLGVVAEPVALQGHLGLELLATQVTEVAPLAAVPVHVGLQVALTAAGVLTHRAVEGLQTYTRARTQEHACVHRDKVCVFIEQRDLKSSGMSNYDVLSEGNTMGGKVLRFVCVCV